MYCGLCVCVCVCVCVWVSKSVYCACKHVCVQLQRELEASHSEVSSLRKQLFSERASTNTLETMLVSTRNKDLHRQLGSQERAAEVHLLRDKLTAADTKASVLHTTHRTHSQHTANYTLGNHCFRYLWTYKTHKILATHNSRHIS